MQDIVSIKNDETTIYKKRRNQETRKGSWKLKSMIAQVRNVMGRLHNTVKSKQVIWKVKFRKYPRL